MVFAYGTMGEYPFNVTTAFSVNFTKNTAGYKKTTVSPCF